MTPKRSYYEFAHVSKVSIMRVLGPVHAIIMSLFFHDVKIEKTAQQKNKNIE